jgi:hypothetical protein
MSKWSSAFRDSRWQKLRLEIMERDGWTCKSCGATGNGVTLNVHHAYYESGKAPWEYPTDTLVTWCEDCHTKIHKAQRQIAIMLSTHDFRTIEAKTTDIIEFLTGIYDSKFSGHPARVTEDDYYCMGYAVGQLDINKTAAKALTIAFNYASCFGGEE